jgi:hypothetical protein
MEFAEALGKRIMKEGPSETEGKIRFAYELCFCRSPRAEEVAFVAKFLAREEARDPAHAWARTARVLLNLDEMIVRE